MAHFFDAANFNWLEAPYDGATAAPLIITCWFKADTDSTDKRLVELVDGSDGSEYFAAAIHADDTYAIAQDSGGASANTAWTAFAANRWQAMMADFRSTTSRKAWHGDSQSTPNTDSRTPTGIDAIELGVIWGGFDWFTGSLAHVAVWDLSGVDPGDREDVAQAIADGAYDDHTVPPDILGLAASLAGTGLTLERYYPLEDEGDFTDHSGNGGDTLTSDEFNYPEYDSDNPGSVHYVSAGTTPTGGATNTGTGTTSCNPDYPAGLAEGDGLAMVLAIKPATATAPTISGWTKISDAEAAGGGGSTGTDTGPTRLCWYFYDPDADGTGVGSTPPSGNLTVTPGSSPTSCWAQMFRMTGWGATDNVWDVAGANGIDSTTGSTFTAAMNVDPGIELYDLVMVAGAIPTDVTTPNQFSNCIVEGTGFDSAVITEVSEPETTAGPDLGGVVNRFHPSGESAGVATVTMTAGGTTTNVRGPICLARFRVADPVSEPIVVEGGIASSSHTGLAGTGAKLGTGGQASETDSGQAGSGAKLFAGGVKRIYHGALVDGDAYGGGQEDPPWDISSMELWEANAGKGASILHYGQFWAEDEVPTPFHETPANNARNHGSIPLIDWNPWDNTDTSDTAEEYTLADIIAGNHDTLISNWFDGAASWGHPFFVRIMHEANGTWFPWGITVHGNTSGEFITAWRHIHDLAMAADATNATFVWCPNVAYSGAPAEIDELYPGDEYVDWVGLDGYNFDPGGVAFDDLFGASVAEVYTVAAADKPMMLAEWATSDDDDPAGWITDAFSEITTNPDYASIRAVVWFNWDTEAPNTWRIESDPGKQAAYAAAVAPYTFVPNEFSTYAISGTIPAPTGPAIEFDSALAGALQVGGGDILVVGGIASETDSGLAGLGDKLYAGGLASSTDTAMVGAILKLFDGGQASEADTGLAGVAIKPILVAGGQASDTETALAGLVDRLYEGGQASEADTALAGIVLKLYEGGQASEEDTGLPGTLHFGDDIIVMGGIAVETDAAMAGLGLKEYEQGTIVSETDTALNGAAVRIYTQTGIASATHVALAGSIIKPFTYVGGIAIETNVGLPGLVQVGVGIFNPAGNPTYRVIRRSRYRRHF